MRTLVIVPHMDDESISCGALIRKRLCDRGLVYVLTLMGRKYNYGEGEQYENEQVEAFDAAANLLRSGTSGVLHAEHHLFEEGEPGTVGYYALLKEIEGVLARVLPHEVLVPSPDDLNQDHRHVADVCRIALRPANLRDVRRILRWHGVDGPLPNANALLPMDEGQLQRKLRAVSCYDMEMRDGCHPRSIENMIARSRVLGSQVGVEFAEPYTLLMERLA